MAGKKRGLGRGLDALLGPTPEAAKVDSAKESDLKDVSHDEETLQLIPVEWIQPGRFQPRRQFDSDKARRTRGLHSTCTACDAAHFSSPD